MKAIALILICALSLGACSTVASQRFVAFPTHNQPPDLQLVDRGQCEDIATMHKQSSGDEAIAMGAITGTAVGAVSGAAYGALLGALSAGVTAGEGSLVGLAIGGAVGLVIGIVAVITAKQDRYERIWTACMQARGYTLGG